MTTRPRPVPLDRSLLTGLAAVALFAVLAAVFLASDFSALTDSFGFPADESIVGSIGAALIGVDAAIDTESFLVALLVIAVALDAALDGSIMLAKREDEEGEARTDGGTDDARTDGGTADARTDGGTFDHVGGDR